MDCVGVLHFNCGTRDRIGGTVTDAKSHHFADSPAGGAIDRNRKNRLQQASSHSGDRIRKWRSLPLSRRADDDLSRSDVGGIKSALLRFKYQEALSFNFGSAAAKGAPLDATEMVAHR